MTDMDRAFEESPLYQCTKADNDACILSRNVCSVGSDSIEIKLSQISSGLPEVFA